MTATSEGCSESGGAVFSDPVVLAEVAALFRRTRARRLAAESHGEAS